MKHRIIIAVDLQNDFIDGALGSPEAVSIVPEAIRRITKAKAEGAVLIATMDTHHENYLETPEGRGLPVPHCIEGTPGWEIRPDIRAALGDDVLILRKPVFCGLQLPEIVWTVLHTRNWNEAETEIELFGLDTDICVVSNAILIKARFPEARTCVYAPASAGVTPASHQAALTVMANCQIEIINREN